MQSKERGVTAAILIDVTDEEVVKRISGRRVCQKSGHVYNVFSDPPKHDDVCDQDGSRLVQREDDAEDVVRNRLSVYHDQTAPLVSFYEERGVLKRFDGTRSPTEVHDHIRATIATLRLEDEL
jgi:adenylate kinase